MDTTQLTQQATDVGNRIKDTAAQLTTKARGSVRDASAAADLYVHEYAWTSLALVAVMAGAIGFLLASSRR